MAYTNGYNYSGYYKQMFGWKPYVPNGTVYLDDISHKVDSLWSSINPGAVDNTGTLLLSGFANGYKKIEIYDNGKLVKVVESNKQGVWSADLSDVLTTGNHNLTIKQQGYGFSGGQPINITIEGNSSEIPVEITKVYDDVGAFKGHIEQNKTTDDARPTLTGKGPANALVTLVVGDNNVIAHGFTDKFGNWQITPEVNIPDGQHEIRAFIDGQFSSSFNITIDTAPAQYPFTFTGAFDYLTYSSIPENGNTNDVRPNFSGKATPGSAVYLFVEGSNEPIGGGITNALGEWSISIFKDLQPGTQTLEVRGDNQFAKFTLTVNSDAVIDPLEINNLIDGQTFELIPENGQSSDTTPWISGKSEPFANVVLLEGSNLLGYVQADGQGKWIYEISSELEAGQHAITAYAGNQISDPFTFTIAAPQTSGGYKGWGSFSLSEATDVYDTELALGDLLVNQPASLFAEDIAQPEATVLTLDQQDLTQESQSVGVEINVHPAATEEPQYLHFA